VKQSVTGASDLDLRQALLGTWRLVSVQSEVDGTVVKSIGDNPLGYLVYTPDGHVFVQMAARERRELFGPSEHGPVLLETTQTDAQLGYRGYSGTFEVRDGQVIHHIEFHVVLRNYGHVEARSVLLEGDRLILGFRNQQLQWQRVH
jgi:hypothetical protein